MCGNHIFFADATIVALVMAFLLLYVHSFWLDSSIERYGIVRCDMVNLRLNHLNRIAATSSNNIHAHDYVSNDWTLFIYSMKFLFHSQSISCSSTSFCVSFRKLKKKVLWTCCDVCIWNLKWHLIMYKWTMSCHKRNDSFWITTMCDIRIHFFYEKKNMPDVVPLITPKNRTEATAKIE